MGISIFAVLGIIPRYGHGYQLCVGFDTFGKGVETFYGNHAAIKVGVGRKREISLLLACATEVIL